MTIKIQKLKALVEQELGQIVAKVILDRGELTLECTSEHYHSVMAFLRDDPRFSFEQLLDLCGVDYLTYKNQEWIGPRFAVVTQLLSLKHNWRVRVKAFAADNDFPAVDSVVDIFNSANWYEREAFDLFGIMFRSHPDLRRILTDYGFIGHPFRKDFPTTGHVEMRYDTAQARVIYQPVTIEPRETTPRVVREENYGG